MDLDLDDIDEELELALALSISEAEENERKAQKDKQTKTDEQLAASSVSSLDEQAVTHTTENSDSNNKREQKNDVRRRNHGTNIYVSNLDDTIGIKRLHDEFSPFGAITSARIMAEGNRSKGFGFVCFSTPEAATKAVTEMNGRTVGLKALYVTLAENRNEHLNLFVKNLDRTIDNDRLRQEFSQFGVITSTKVMMEGRRSKGFGFVCFSNPDEAAMAIAGMHGQILGSKFLYVAPAENKGNRKARLTAETNVNTLVDQSPAQNSKEIDSFDPKEQDSQSGQTELTKAPREEPDEKLSCKICFEKDFSHILACHHVLCESCADTIFNNQYQCPFCREAISSRPKPIHF